MTEPEEPVVVAAPVEAAPPQGIVLSRRVAIIGAGVVLVVMTGLVAALVYVSRAAPKKVEEIKPITSVQPAAPAADAAALKQAAEAKKQELLQMHARVLQSDSTGVIPDFPKVRTLPKSPSMPEAIPTAPAAAMKGAPGPATTPKPEAPKATIPEKPQLTPLGSEGLGVSKENLGGLLPAIEAMNAMDGRKRKPQEK